MAKLNKLDLIALILVIVGGLNWGLIGLEVGDVVAFLGATVARIVYVLVGLSAVYLAVILSKLERK